VKIRQLFGFERALYIKVEQGDTLSINRHTAILLAAWAIVAAASPTGAQPASASAGQGSATGAITGIVTGDGGNRMHGVQVVAQSAAN